MHFVSGNVPWKIHPIPTQYNYLTKDISTEVAIIGGGITGAITAYVFSQANIPVVLLEKGIIGYQSTRASTSILQYEIDYTLLELAKLYGTKEAVLAFKDCEHAINEIQSWVQHLEDCQYKRRKCLYYTEDKTEIETMQKEFLLRKDNGFSVQQLDMVTGKKLFSFPIQAGILSSHAAEINPYTFTHQLIKQAAHNGSHIYENTGLVDIKHTKDGIQITTQHNSIIRAKKVVIATGYSASSMINKELTTFSRSFSIVTKPNITPSRWYGRCIIRDTKNPYYYLRSLPEDRILIGGEDIPLNGITSPLSELDGTDPISKEKYTSLLRHLNALFPDLLLTMDDIEYAFSGIFGDTPDSLPYIGELEQYPNHFFNLGYGANGIPYAVIGANLILKLFLGKSPKELGRYSFYRNSL